MLLAWQRVPSAKDNRTSKKNRVLENGKEQREIRNGFLSLIKKVLFPYSIGPWCCIKDK